MNWQRGEWGQSKPSVLTNLVTAITDSLLCLEENLAILQRKNLYL